MASCSSGIRLSQFGNLQNGGFSEIGVSRLVFVKMQGNTSNGYLVCRGSKSRFLVKSLLSEESESQSGASFSAVLKESDSSSVSKDAKVLDSSYVAKPDRFSGGDDGDLIDGNGGNGKFTGGGGGGGGGNDNEGNDKEEDEFGPLLKFEEVMRETEARGATLPADMLEAAKSAGIREVLLLRYLDLQVQFSICGLILMVF